MLLLASLAYFLASVVFYSVNTLTTPSDLACVRTLFPYSMAEEVIEYDFKNFHSDFSPKSAYRGPPTAERETKWDSLAPFGLLRVGGKRITTPSRGAVESQRRAVPAGSEEALVVPGIVLSMNCLVSCVLFNASNPHLLTEWVQEITSTIHLRRIQPDDI
ncbi:hypothetical protein JX266_011642 [Neoarthrinium moseri]|nr:hypothetical protein JX266_011642 [Neoarthrinium moseri]